MITQPYPNFIRPDAGGNVKPISNGLIYVGQAGLDPISHPIDVFYKDNNGTEQKIDQPIRLNATGIPVAGENDGAIIRPYTGPSTYSILIVDKNGKDQYTNKNATGYATGEQVDQAQSDIVGGSIFKGSNGETVEVGDKVPAGTSILRFGGGLFPIITKDGKYHTITSQQQVSAINISTLPYSVTIGVTEYWLADIKYYMEYSMSSRALFLGDGQTGRDAEILAALFNFGGVIHFDSRQVIDGEFSTVQLKKDTIIKAGLATFRDATISSDSSSSLDRVKIQNAIFDTTKVSGVNAHYSVYLYNCSNAKLVDCEVKNVRVRIDNNQPSSDVYGAYIEDCFFDCDFSNFDYEVSQEDPIKIKGITNAVIEGNTFLIKNVHRLAKITAADETNYPPVSGRSSGISFRSNFVIGETTSGKQMVDMFVGTTNFVLESNFIKVRGFAQVFENKSGYAFPEDDMATSYKVSKNYANFDGQFCRFQGGYGNVTNPTNGYYDCSVDDNTLVSHDTDTDRPIISVRFMHSADVSGKNRIVNKGVPSGNKPVIEVLSSKSSKVCDNTADAGYILFGIATSNTQGDTFDSVCKSIVANNNTIEEFLFDAAVCVNYPSGISDRIDTLNISSNTIKESTGDNSILGAVQVKNAIVESSVVNGNVSVITNSARDRFNVVSSTINKSAENGNTWNREADGIITLSDGDTITHGLNGLPRNFYGTARNSPVGIYSKGVTETDITVGLIDMTTGSAPSSPVSIYWNAKL